MKIRALLVGLFLAVFLVRCIEACLPYDHSDALYYHLAGARIWFERSYLDLITNLPSYAQAGLFDSFYYPLFYFKLGLVKTQSLAQFLHFFFSIGAASLFAFMTSRKTLWGTLAALSVLTIAKDGSYFLYAKNDGVLAMVGLLAAYMVIEKKEKTWIIAFLFGLLPMIKLSGLYVLMPLSLLYVYKSRKIKNIFQVATLSGLMLAFVLLKNYFITGNPFFPGMSHRFPGLMSQSMIEYNNSFFGNGVNAKTIMGLLSDLFLGKLLLLLSFPLFFYNLRKNSWLNAYFLVAISIFSIYLMTNGGYQAARFFFTCHFILIYFIFKSLQEFEGKKAWVIAILLLILADAKLDKSVKRAFYALKDYSSLNDEEIMEKRIPHTLFWKNLVKGNGIHYILSDYVAETYYLPKDYILHIPDHSPQADFLYHCDGERKNALKLYQYALISRNIMNPCYEEIKKGKLLQTLNGISLYQLF